VVRPYRNTAHKPAAHECPFCKGVFGRGFKLHLNACFKAAAAPKAPAGYVMRYTVSNGTVFDATGNKAFQL